MVGTIAHKEIQNQKYKENKMTIVPFTTCISDIHKHAVKIDRICMQIETIQKIADEYIFTFPPSTFLEALKKEVEYHESKIAYIKEYIKTHHENK
jgi:hypothetical protein